MRAIREKLDALGKWDLYDFLGALGSRDHRVLVRQAQRIIDDCLGDANKTAELTFRQELAGQALKLFQSPDGVLRYDASLAEDGLTELVREIDDVARVTREVTAAQVTLLLKKAEGRGLDVEEVRLRIMRHCKGKYSLEMPSREALR